MTLAQLNYFVKVAENGHLTQTAKELLIAQPSLTQAIRKLEEELGFLLFEKKGRVLFLTKEGKEFLPYAKEVVEASKGTHLSEIYRKYSICIYKTNAAKLYSKSVKRVLQNK